jgi:hypothetical protein
VEKAKAEAAAIVATAQKTLDDATSVKASHDAALAAAVADRKALASERAAAAKLGEDAERTRQKFEAGFAELRVVAGKLLDMQSTIDEYVKALADVSAALDGRAAVLDRAAATLGGGVTVQ